MQYAVRETSAPLRVLRRRFLRARLCTRLFPLPDAAVARMHLRQHEAAAAGNTDRGRAAREFFAEEIRLGDERAAERDELKARGYTLKDTPQGVQIIKD